jgi:UDP-N-acetylmuramyl pentapeptide phosphotransferase/UDP-N-acetylglucosamine-1-phosphate transferase
MLTIVGLGASVCAASLVLTGLLARRRSSIALDYPNDRSLHAQPTQRTGGVAIMASVVLLGACALALEVGDPSDRASFTWILGLGGAVAAFSFVEDLYGLSPALRLLLHGAAAGLFLWALDARVALEFINLPSVSVAVTLLFVMWMMNLYNFMDGIDGLAGGMAIIGFGFLAYLTRGGSTIVPLAALLIACATLGFLAFNFPPARIFLGDVGAVSLGFLAGGLSALAVSERTIDLAVPLMLFSPFIIDATVTLLRRLLRGEEVWRPHRQHWYQRLVLAGWTHRRTTLAEYVLMMTCGLLSVVYAEADTAGRLAVLVVLGGLYLLVPWGVSAVERRAVALRPGI